jgi:hypothetical protein
MSGQHMGWGRRGTHFIGGNTEDWIGYCSNLFIFLPFYFLTAVPLAD